MDCEIITLDDDVVYSRPEWGDRCILVIAKLTHHNQHKYWIHCFKCHVTANVPLHTVKIKDGLASLWASIECPNKKCREHYFIRD